MRSITFAILASLSMSCASTHSLTHHLSREETTLLQLQGRAVVINFWADWCPPCIEEMPTMASLVAKEGRDVAFFFAYFEREPRSRQFMDWLSKQPRWFQDRVYWATSPLRLQYLNNAIPVTVVLDRNGKLVEVIEGSIKGRENHFQETIRRALATQFTPPSVAEPPK